MVIAILIIVGIPLWVIAILLFLLFKGWSKVKAIPGSFTCRTRVVSGDLPGFNRSFARYNTIGHWVHEVLILHGGNPFLIKTTPLGIAELLEGPVDLPEGAIKHIKNPVSIRFRHDTGAVFEVVSTKAQAAGVLGSFLASPRPQTPKGV